MSWLEDTIADPVGAAMVVVGAATGQYWLVGMGLSHIQGESAAEKRKQQQNDATTNRTQQIKSAAAVRRLLFGRVATSGPILYAQSTGAKNEFLHHVTALASGQIDAVESIRLNETTLPALDANGFVTSGDFYAPGRRSVRARRVGNGTITAAGPVLRIVSAVYHTMVSNPDLDSKNQNKAISILASTTFAGSTITVTGAPTSAHTVDVQYEYNSSFGLIRAKTVLGSASQTAFADLVTESGGKWTTAHKLNSVAALYIRQQYADPFAQIGMGNWSAVCRGSLCYDPRENAALQSAALGVSPWTTDVASTTVSADALANPFDGGITADKLAETAITNVHNRYQAFTAAAAGVHTWSVYAKAVERSLLRVSFGTGALVAGIYSEFDLASGTCTAPVLSGGATLGTAQIIPAGNGWYRCVVQCTMPASATMYGAVWLQSAAGVTSYAGTAGSGVYIWGASKSGANLVEHTLTTTAARSPVTVWSENAALCLAQYMTTPVNLGGMGIPLSDINLTDLTYSAEICDQLVTIDAVGTTQKRYTVGAAISSDSAPRDNLDKLLAAMDGKLLWVRGQWRILAGAYRAPSLTITEDMIVGDSLSVSPYVQRSALINRVNPKYTEPSKGWVQTDAPAATSATYVTEDGGYDLPQEIQLDYVTNQHQANRLGWIRLNKSRSGMTVQLTTTMAAYDLAPGDFVAVTSTTMGWSAKEFQVLQRKFSPSKCVLTYTLQAVSAAIWAWSYTGMTALDLTPNTTLPNALAAPAELAGLTAQSGTNQLIRGGDGTFLIRGLISWTAPSEQLVAQGGTIEIEWKKANADVWQQGATVPGDTVSAYISPLPDTGIIQIRARAVTSSKRYGPWATIEHQVVGLTQAPADPTGFAAADVLGGKQLSWTKNTELDYLRTELRVGATWATATVVTLDAGSDGYFWKQLTAGSYTLWISHVDTSGNYSMTPASIITAVGIASLVGSSAIAAGAVSASSAGAQAATGYTVTAGVVTNVQKPFGPSFSRTDSASNTEVSGYATIQTVLQPVATLPAGNYFIEVDATFQVYDAANTLISIPVSSLMYDMREVRVSAGSAGATYSTTFPLRALVPAGVAAGVITPKLTVTARVTATSDGGAAINAISSVIGTGFVAHSDFKK